MSKVLNLFIMQIHKFFFLFVLFFSFLFCHLETIYWTKYAVFLPLSFCIRGKPLKTRVFWWLVNTSANISGHIHGRLSTVLVLLINYYTLVGDFFFHSMLRHISSRCQDLLNMKVQILVFSAEMGGALSLNFKSRGLNPPCPLYLRPWVYTPHSLN